MNAATHPIAPPTALRNIDIAAQVLEGKSSLAVGREHGITKHRVAQIVKREAERIAPEFATMTINELRALKINIRASHEH